MSHVVDVYLWILFMFACELIEVTIEGELQFQLQLELHDMHYK